MRYFLELCLKSVVAALNDLDAEIIVIDNCSSDDSCQMVKTLFPKVILIENQENYGFSKGNNIGVAQAKGEYVCILNPDTVVAEDTFKILLKFANSAKNLGIVGCKLIDGLGNFLPESKRNVPTPFVSVQKILGNSKPYYASHLRENETGEVAILVGAFMLLKRAIYNEICGFDEDFFMYGEDLDFSYRVQKAGYINYYNPTTTIIHFKGESTLKDTVYAKRFNEAIQIFFKKHFKSNIFYKRLISIGIKGVTLLNSTSKHKKSIVSNHVLMAEESNDMLQNTFKYPMSLYLKDSELHRHSQITFDNRSNTFKSIIDFISTADPALHLTYRIIPKNSRFSIGSDSSKDRGEVLKF